MIFCIPSVDPVCHIHRSIGAPVQPSRQNSTQDFLSLNKFEGCSFGFKLKRMNPGLRRTTDKFSDKESVFPFRSQSCTRIVQHSRWTIDVVDYRGCNVSSLSFKTWLIQFF